MDVMVCIFVFSPNSYVEIPMLDVMLRGAFGGAPVMNVEAPCRGSVFLYK